MLSLCPEIKVFFGLIQTFFFLQALYQSVNRRLCLFQDLGDVGRDTKEPVQSDGVWKRRALLAGRFTQYHSKYCMCFAKKTKTFCTNKHTAMMKTWARANRRIDKQMLSTDWQTDGLMLQQRTREQKGNMANVCAIQTLIVNSLGHSERCFRL